MADTNENRIDDQKKNEQLPALWAGVECSITRVRGTFRDQLEMSGHYNREDDINAFASLGISALRFPILIEKHQPFKNTPIDWTWATNQLNGLREKNITPIAGLIHHGSGPAYTNLLSSDFAQLLARFAENVAQQFPWIEYYTPVNEPLTTARFSGLYGLWFPHHTNDRSFCRMLVNELTAVVLSMQAIRRINPSAKLVQTEDLGKIYAVENLQYQADFENMRRWLTFDILCGRMDRDHPLWQFFIENGISRKSLEFFLQNPCPPHILGLNHYVTSERYLDDNIDAYPKWMCGGNHIEKYVDTEAVRIPHGQPSGLPVLLREVHERYGLPMAMTEVHLHCTREEQMRWFTDVWNTCCKLKQQGLNIKAVTAWSLLGAFGWNKLLTSDTCDYEPGVFDLRADAPHPTALAKLIRSLANGTSYNHPVLSYPGWWKRNERFHPYSQGAESDEPPAEQIAPVLIYGDGEIAEALYHICRSRAIPFIAKKNNEFDLSCSEDITAAIAFFKPWAIISANSFPEPGERMQTDEEELHVAFAKHCSRFNVPLLYFSDAEVFAADNSIPWHEEDMPVPVTDRGKLIKRLEEIVLTEHPDTLLVRTGILFSSSDHRNPAYKLANMLQGGKSVKAGANMLLSFSQVNDVVNVALDLLIDGEKGVCHLVNEGQLSWFDFANEICRHAGLAPDMVFPGDELSSINTPLLGSRRFRLMPSVHCAIANFTRHLTASSEGYGQVLQKRV